MLLYNFFVFVNQGIVAAKICQKLVLSKLFHGFSSQYFFNKLIDRLFTRIYFLPIYHFLKAYAAKSLTKRPFGIHETPKEKIQTPFHFTERAFE